MRRIDADALKKAIEKGFEENFFSDYEPTECVCKLYDDCINNAPTVEPEKIPVCNLTFDEDKLKEIVDKLKNEIISGEIVLHTDNERLRGNWIVKDIYPYKYSYTCECCKKEYIGNINGEIAVCDFNYCPKCGAMMHTEEYE